jgi:hypothetical protein
MSKLQIIFLSVGVSVCTCLVMGGLAWVLLPSLASNTSVSLPAGTIFGGGPQISQQAALPTTPPADVEPAPTLKICKSDVEKLCADQKTDSDQAHCLHAHFDQVAANCHAHLEKMRNSLPACKSEMHDYCEATGYGGGRMVECLRTHLSKLSSACAALISRMPKI